MRPTSPYGALRFLLVVILVQGFAARTMRGQAPDEFVIDDRVVSNPSISLADPEFDQTRFRMTWQDPAGNLWLARINPMTGALVPASGRGAFLDSGLAPISETLQGPEWVYGSDGVRIVYTKIINEQFALATVRRTADQGWLSGVLQAGARRIAAAGTPRSSTAPGAITYYVVLPLNTLLGWRTVSDPSSEAFLPEVTSDDVGAGFRWVEDLPLIVISLVVTDELQVFLKDTESGTLTQITTDAGQKRFPFMWWAPERQALLLMCSVDADIVGIYQEIGGAWTRIYSIDLPSPKPFVHSPEPFVYNGQSYVSMVAVDEIGEPPGLPVGPTDIWIAGIDSSDPFFRQVSTNDSARQRLDPESLILSGGPVIYYTERRSPGNFVLRRAATGL